MPLCTAAASPPGLPDWLLGTWDTYEVRLSKRFHYLESTPKDWYASSTLKISRDRISYADHACEQFTVRPVRGSLQDPLWYEARVGPWAFDLPPEHGPVNYLEIRCGKELVDSVDGKSPATEMGIRTRWYIILRSHTEIDMPFLGASYIRLRRPAATS